ncbi:hypothetical protein LOKO_01907 [Halomonas chromatireducens]|uniref:Cation-transporting P-type ATPase C-terminal domain-containing protein n=1 Tax=Halomonas chromatireducens TaxID=507626 RepID=A0A0X8HE47_9GAMM|nr:cation transporting ATPase C-terminal domain-containing protein [Halomonas chromatireducens]AMD00975.1 hypothetical protein LOKO_01907 [Halomonas chromatireducens]
MNSLLCGSEGSLVMGSAAYLINSRFLVHSALSVQGIFGSQPVWMAIGLVVLLQLGWTYLPFMQTVFGSAGLAPLHWLVILAGSVSIFLIVELEKWVLRVRKSPDTPAAGQHDKASASTQ